MLFNLEEYPLLLLGCFLLAGYVAHVVGNKTHVPRVILLLLVGIAAGPAGFNVVPEGTASWFPVVTQAALSVVGFELGEKFFGASVKAIGRPLLVLSVLKVVGTSLMVFTTLLLFGVQLELALIFAGIAPATAPAATIDVIEEVGASGTLTDTTLRLVAIDDAWGIIIFSILAALAAALSDNSQSLLLVLGGIEEVFGSILLGAGLALPMSWVTGRATKGELTLIETLGFVFVCGGAASLLGLSYLLACMTMGCVVSNTARHHARPFHAIKNIQQPFLIVFFLLAGFSVEFSSINTLGVISGAYIFARIIGGIVSGYFGARLAQFPATVQKLIGLCMLPQAGVALGLGLVAAERFPQLAEQIISVTVGTTVVFELFGPLTTRYALHRSGESGSI
jgi:Kef-type K+ transport system membrane component KefB